jgi:hypothetical protein
MFVRKKKNKSGVVSVQVITKLDGKSRLVKTIGSSARPDEVERLVEAEQSFARAYSGKQELDFSDSAGLL